MKNSLKLFPVLLALVGIFQFIAVAHSFEPQVTFKLHESNPVLNSGPKGNFDGAYLDPGAIIYHNGEFHMFYSGLPRWPHPLAIGYATSKDGLQWQKQSAEPILTADQTGLTDSVSINSDSIVVSDQGQWMLFFSVVARDRGFIGKIARATAPSPRGPWTVDNEAVIGPGPKSAWDGNKVGHAHVIKNDDGYVMYYSGTGDKEVGGFAEEHSQIGMATSTDGAQWTKYDNPETTNPALALSDPVLSPSETKDAWDSWHVRNTRVSKIDDRWKMVYGGASFNESGNFGVAISQDGITWKRLYEQPILKSRSIGKVISFNSFIHHNNQDLIYIEAGTSSGTQAFLAVKAEN